MTVFKRKIHSEEKLLTTRHWTPALSSRTCKKSTSARLHEGRKKKILGDEGRSLEQGKVEKEIYRPNLSRHNNNLY